jgi:hypothetical protein
MPLSEKAVVSHCEDHPDSATFPWQRKPGTSLRGAKRLADALNNFTCWLPDGGKKSAPTC